MIDKIQKRFIYLIPISLVFSIFVADALVSLVAILFVISQTYEKNYKIFLNKYFLFFFIFWIYLIINSFFSYNMDVSLSRSLPYIRFGLLFLAISYFASDTTFKKNLFKIIFFIVLIICIDSIIQYFFGYNLLGYKGHRSRISSFFNEELVLGRFLLSMYPLVLISIFYFEKKRIFQNNYFLTFLVSIYMFVIYISGERTAFFLFLMINIFFIIFLIDRINLKNTILILIISSLLIFISTKHNKHTIERYLTIKNIFKSGDFIIFTQIHEKHYLTALKIYDSNKILGSGLKTFREVCKKPEFNPEGCSTHPHNIFMQFLSELGILGISFYLISFLYFISKLLISFFKRKTILGEKSNFYKKIFLLSFILISIWPLSPSGNFFNNWLSILTFFPVGFLIYYEKKFLNKS